jgi:fructose-1,6-bisphosphatase/inositol monophosphatase family enzyme
MLKISPLFFKNALEKLTQRCRHYFYENSQYSVRDLEQARAKYLKFQAVLVEKIVTEISIAFEEQPEGHCYILQEYLKEKNPAEHSFVLEIIDGEENFLRQIPFFGLSLTYIYKGIAQEFGYLDPIHDEFFHACKGKGAQLNNRRLESAFCPDLLLQVGRHAREPRSTILDRAFGALSLSLCYVAANRLDVLIASEREATAVNPGAKLLLKEAKVGCFEYHDQRSLEKYALFGDTEVLTKIVSKWNQALYPAKQ